MTTSGDKKEYLFGIPYVELPTYRIAEEVGNKEIPTRNPMNLELLDQTLAFIKAHPLTWDQDSWFRITTVDGDIYYQKEKETVEEQNSCSSSFCFAGHVAISQGFPFPPKDNGQDWERSVLHLDENPEDTYEYREGVSEFAEKVLGLTPSQADLLFAGKNTLEDLETIVAIFHKIPNVRGWVLSDALQEARDDGESLDVELFVKRYEEEFGDESPNEYW